MGRQAAPESTSRDISRPHLRRSPLIGHFPHPQFEEFEEAMYSQSTKSQTRRRLELTVRISSYGNQPNFLITLKRKKLITTAFELVSLASRSS